MAKLGVTNMAVMRRLTGVESNVTQTSVLVSGWRGGGGEECGPSTPDETAACNLPRNEICAQSCTFSENQIITSNKNGYYGGKKKTG